MAQTNERGASAHGLRSSALWGTGSRGGDSRSSVLWGKGGRGIVATCIAVCALAAPLAAMAEPGKSNGGAQASYVAADLLATAKAKPGQKVRIIVQSTLGTDDASAKLTRLGPLASVEGRLELVDGVVAEVPGALVEKLQAIPGLSVTPDAPVKTSGVSSGQLWPWETGSVFVANDDSLRFVGKLPTIAIVDSGVQARTDFTGRLLASVNLTTLSNNSAGDGRGHGTFVAGIAAGGAADLPGAAPTAPLVSIDVMNDNGTALTSDVIKGAAWILANRTKYNIRVANFSLHSLRPSSFLIDPLDQAVEKLWFAGVTVVAAAGNYGTAGAPSGVKYAPGNDPFVITVGAVDLGGTYQSRDDTGAPWSAYGRTYDGFTKPEVSAPGRYIVGPVPATSTIARERPEKLVGADRIQLSGTSFAAPMVAATAAQILARNPTWGPDRVKGALMVTAQKLADSGYSGGYGEIVAPRAVSVATPPNPNAALRQFVKTTSSGVQYFDAMSWAVTALTNKSWDALAWSDLAWTDLAWSDLAWTDLAWTDLAWADLAWTDMAWTDSAIEDAVAGEGTSDTSVYLAEQGDLEQATKELQLLIP